MNSVEPWGLEKAMARWRWVALLIATITVVVGAFGQLAEQPPGDQTVLGDGPRDGLSVFLANEATVVAQASGPKDPICNGADHDGSGTVGIVELADAVAQTGAQHRHEVAAIPASYEKVVETPTQVP